MRINREQVQNVVKWIKYVADCIANAPWSDNGSKAAKQAANDESVRSSEQVS